MKRADEKRREAAKRVVGGEESEAQAVASSFTVQVYRASLPKQGLHSQMDLLASLCPCRLFSAGQDELLRSAGSAVEKGEGESGTKVSWVHSSIILQLYQLLLLHEIDRGLH